ncbi:SWI/SNF complex subunit Swi3p [[Candida] jaroonii]|uniref:SWI/SNF complex subunit Swi3p n=1 Tax=[Candida] jaroonii TaxID=467808 RepID=A0ACA9YGL0_9ASCO|nr:SWI/SNF complex subunit Swi3p [[Candida] jaroonii]
MSDIDDAKVSDMEIDNGINFDDDNLALNDSNDMLMLDIDVKSESDEKDQQLPELDESKSQSEDSNDVDDQSIEDMMIQDSPNDFQKDSVPEISSKGDSGEEESLKPSESSLPTIDDEVSIQEVSKISDKPIKEEVTDEGNKNEESKIGGNKDEDKTEENKKQAEEAKEESKKEKEEWLEPEIDESTVRPFKQTHTVIIPSYSSWFNIDKINKIEKTSLPEFFKNHPSKSPKIYIGYRNFMVNAYRLNPNEYLTLTSCRRNLVGDVGSIMRVFKFLNKWGLINYQVNPTFKPNFNLERLANGNLAPLPFAGEFKISYDTPRGLFPFETYKVNSDLNVEKLKHLITKSGKDFKNNDIKTNEINEDNENNERIKREQNFEDESPNKKVKDNWNNEDESKLLKLINQYKNDWFKISKELGKTPQECILKFLKLPIDDNFSKLSIKEFELMKFSSNFPVNNIDNPIINNLIFMSQLVDSDVAKVASEEASKKMHEKLLEKLNGDEKIDEDKQKQEIKDIEGLINSTLFGIIGSKSYLFSKFEEREMFKISNLIINQELNKINLKLDKINKLEKIYENERKQLIKSQEEIFIERLNLTQSTISISKKFQDIIKTLEKNDISSEIKQSLNDIKSLIFKPNKSILIENDKTDEKEVEINDIINPVSVTDPQNFKVWVP